MSITPIGPQGTWPAGSAPTSSWQNVLTAASATLSISLSTLQQQLVAGQSLSSLAQGKGVAPDDMIASIADALRDSGRLSGASSSQLHQIATQIANRASGAQTLPGPRQHEGAASSRYQRVDRLA